MPCLSAWLFVETKTSKNMRTVEHSRATLSCVLFYNYVNNSHTHVRKLLWGKKPSVTCAGCGANQTIIENKLLTMSENPISKHFSIGYISDLKLCKNYFPGLRLATSTFGTSSLKEQMTGAKHTMPYHFKIRIINHRQRNLLPCRWKK